MGYVAEKCIILILHFSVDHIFHPNRLARISTIQGTVVPVPLRPSAAARDCTALIWYGQHPSNTCTVYGAQP